ncbi:hypothetical protein [uncultured Bartonella sp.]|nr:hypothetical protein [uncultured Bartonella sp.]
MPQGNAPSSAHELHELTGQTAHALRKCPRDTSVKALSTIEKTCVVV